MKNEERQQWLDSLKIGDEVAIDIGRYGIRDYEIRRIERITPNRRMSLEGKGAEFDCHGNERGKKDVWTPRMSLQPVTQEIRDAIRKRYVVARLEKVKWSQLELSRLEKMLTVLDSDD